MRLGFVLIVMAILVNGCIKFKTFPPTPVITFKSMSVTEVKQGQTPIKIIFNFTDGDGDIGLTQQDTSKDILILDLRRGNPVFSPIQYDYRMPYVTPEGNNKSISGELAIDIPNTFCRPGLTVDTLRYSIQIKDRAGNKSNILETPTVIVRQ
jgi:hypothetical protein